MHARACTYIAPDALQQNDAYMLLAADLFGLCSLLLLLQSGANFPFILPIQVDKLQSPPGFQVRSSHQGEREVPLAGNSGQPCCSGCRVALVTHAAAEGHSVHIFSSAAAYTLVYVHLTGLQQ
jgi:hypothetical protein